MIGTLKTECKVTEKAAADTMSFRIKDSLTRDNYKDSAAKGSIVCNQITKILVDAGADKSKISVKTHVEEGYIYLDKNGNSCNYNNKVTTVKKYTFNIAVEYTDDFDAESRDIIYGALLNSGLELDVGTNYWCRDRQKYVMMATAEATRLCRQQAETIANNAGAKIIGVKDILVDNRGYEQPMIRHERCDVDYSYCSMPVIDRAEPELYTPEGDDVTINLRVEWAIESGPESSEAP